MIRSLSCFASLVLSLAFAMPAGTQEPKKEDAKKEEPKKEVKKDKTKAKDPSTPAKKTHKVEKGPLKVEVSLKGVFEAETMTEVFLAPEVFTPDVRGVLRVLKAVEHGAEVKKGDMLVWLDMERIDQMIAELEKDRDGADLAIKLAQEELANLEKNTPLDLAAAERGKKLADEDLKRFLSLEKDFLTKAAHFEAKSANDWLLYAKEELKQLEKMYKASDLTESTEEIILKRQRDMVERAAFFVKMAETDRDLALTVTLPRKEEGLKETNVKQTLSLEKAKATLPLQLNQKRIALDKMKFERERAVEKLQKFKKDREAMIVKAPANGIVYHGKCTRGAWSLDGKLQRGRTLSSDEVFITIVKPRPYFVRATVEEKDFAEVSEGVKGKVVPTPLPKLKIPARAGRVSAIPVSSGNFEVRVTLESDKDTAALMPGMACTVKLVPYQKLDALTVPSAAVFSDDLDEDKHFVYTQGKDGKHAKVTVTVGRKSGDKIEILEGVREGDEVLLEKPEPAKKGVEK